METRLGLIDYGMGNLHSVELAFKRLQKSLLIVRQPSDLNQCDALILPGVGAFDPAMENLEATKLVPDLKTWAKENRPLLGICLGLQLLFESSDEGKLKGLGLFEGKVTRLNEAQGERVPHMGWAPLDIQKPSPLLSKASKSNWVYFVHSFAAMPANQTDIAATATFGASSITSLVWKGRVGACQFHPEKSSFAGNQMLIRWLNWLESGAKPF